MKTIKVIDSHIHISNWMDSTDLNHEDYRQFITPFKEIERFGWKDAPVSHNYKESVNAFIDSRNYEYVNIACIPYIGRDAAQNIMAALLKEENKKVFAHGGLVYPDRPVSFPFKKGFEPDTQLDELMKIGFDGVKMLETHPKAKMELKAIFTDKGFAPLFKRIEEEQIHILWHVNDPIEHWNDVKFANSENPDREEVYGEVYEILRRYPRLKVTFAHMFYMTTQRERLEKLLDDYPNVCIDITPGPSNFHYMSENITDWREFFLKYSDRIMFGSDYSTRGGGYSIPCVYRFLLTDDSFKMAGMDVQGMALDEDTLDKIFYGNFLKRVGQRPRQIDTEALSAYIKKYDSLLTNEINRFSIFNDCKEKGIFL